MGRDEHGSRPMMYAVAGQQKLIDALQARNAALAHDVEVLKMQLDFISQTAGLNTRTDAIRVKAAEIREASLKQLRADVNNPGQPVPDPGSQGPSETTEQAVTPETSDDPRRPGQTPGSVQDIAADTTDLAMNPGESLPTSPYGDMVDVTAPVAGTETHVPNEQTRIETDVRVGDPMNQDTAFPWITGPNQSNGQPPGSGEMAGKAGSKVAGFYGNDYETVRKHLNDIDPGGWEDKAPSDKDYEGFNKYVKSNYPEHYDSYFGNHEPENRRYEEHEGHTGHEGAKKVATKQPVSPGGRTMIALRLAELWRENGFDTDSLVAVTGKIDSSDMSEHDIEHEIRTLSRVQTTASQRPPANLVPRAASKTRATPSMASGITAAASAAEGAEDLFL